MNSPGIRSRVSSLVLSNSDIPHIPNSSRFTKLGIIVTLVNLTVPISYIYAFTVLLNTLGPPLVSFFSLNPPYNIAVGMVKLSTFMNSVPNIYHIWSFLELVFWLVLKTKKNILSAYDPLQMSLSSAPLMPSSSRSLLFSRILDSTEDVEGFIKGWFFDVDTSNVGRYDVMDWCSWSLFEGRNQEHLTKDEIVTLKGMVDEIEKRIASERGVESFCFPKDVGNHGNVFSNLWKGMARQVRQRRTQVGMTEGAMLVHQSYNDAYNAVVTPGGRFERLLTSLAAAPGEGMRKMEDFRVRVGEWVNSEHRERVMGVASRSKKLEKKLKAYKLLLANMRVHESSISARQMCGVMRKISSLHNEIEGLENEAASIFSGISRLGMNFIPIKHEPPLRYAKYSADPLFDICEYPLFSHLLMLGLTEGVLRVLFRKRGFKRGKVGDVGYYYRIPTNVDSASANDDNMGSFGSTDHPIVFVHGIGIGLIAYITFIDKLVSTGRTVFLPEVSCVNAFRVWQTPSAVKNGAMVASTLSAMLSSHGFAMADFVGHSYGTSWLSYMAKIAPEFVGTLVFVDPICFCLHHSHLTRQFIYQRANPGDVSYLIRTDLMVHFTLQRAFPWSRISLFVEELEGLNTAVFLSEEDCLVPSDKISTYINRKGGVVGSSDDWENFFRGVGGEGSPMERNEGTGITDHSTDYSALTVLKLKEEIKRRGNAIPKGRKQDLVDFLVSLDSTDDRRRSFRSSRQSRSRSLSVDTFDSFDGMTSPQAGEGIKNEKGILACATLKGFDHGDFLMDDNVQMCIVRMIEKLS